MMAITSYNIKYIKFEEWCDNGVDPPTKTYLR